MKCIVVLLSLILVGRVSAEDKLTLDGIWIPVDEGLKCICGHETQLRITATVGDYDYSLTEFCLGHRAATPLGGVLLARDNLKLIDLNKNLKYSISADKKLLTLEGGTITGKEPLVLRRLDLVAVKAFKTKLSKIPASELKLTRSSYLFPESNERRPAVPNKEVPNKTREDKRGDRRP